MGQRVSDGPALPPGAQTSETPLHVSSYPRSTLNHAVPSLKEPQEVGGQGEGWE